MALEVPSEPLSQIRARGLGLNLGLKNLVYDSDGHNFDNINKRRPVKTLERKIKILHTQYQDPIG